jgi:competence protein ComEC
MGVRAFVLLASGAALALWLGPDRSPPMWSVVAVGGALAIVGVLARARAGWVALALATLAIGFGVAGARTFEYPGDSVARSLGSGMTILRVEGIVLDEPTTARPTRGELARFVRDEPATRFTLRVTGVVEGDNVRHASGDLWVRVEGVLTTVRAGDRVRIAGRAFPVEALTNPGEQDFRPRARERNIAGRVLVPSAGLVERIGAGSTARPRLVAAQAALRERASSWVERLDHDERTRALLGAALFGATDGEYTRVQRAFARTGLAHLLAISGLHLALLAWFALLGARAVLPGRRAQATIVALAVVAYLLIVPANPPVVRAGVMTLGFLLADSLGRRYDPLNVLGWTACAIVLVRPTDVTSVGFQLSFLAVGGLIALASPTRDAILRLARVPVDHPDKRTARQRVAHRVASALGASLAAWAITAPLVALRVGMFTPLAPIAAVLVAPLFAITLGMGYLATLASVVAPSLGAPVGWVAGLLAWGFLAAVDALDAVPFVVAHTAHFGWWWAALGTIAIAMALKGRNPRLACAAIGMVLVAIVARGASSSSPGADVALRIDTLDVGDGSCHLIRVGDESMLWDCGSTWVGIGEREIPDALRALGAWRVRTLVISHPNLDHYSGALDAADRLGLREVLTTRAFLDEAARDPLGPVAFTLDALRRRGVRVRAIGAGHEIALGDARMEFLWPREGFTTDQPNDESLVARVRVPTEGGARTAIFFGDIEPDGIDAMVRDTGPLNADIAEAPHHGSARPRAIAFVASLGASVVVQSTGPQRLGDERWDNVKASTTWWTTAADGAVFVEALRDGTIVSGRSR